MCPLPLSELTGVTFIQSVLAFRRQDEVLKEVEQFRLEHEALKADQGNNPVDSRGFGWLRQRLSAFVKNIVKKQPQQQPNHPVFTRR